MGAVALVQETPAEVDRGVVDDFRLAIRKQLLIAAVRRDETFRHGKTAGKDLKDGKDAKDLRTTLGPLGPLSRVQLSKRNSRSPVSTWAPACTSTSATLPSFSAYSVVSIFIASSVNSLWPAGTSSPASTI